jgi:glycosyltransferase involved in cell wall biosynthesis
MIKNLKIAVVIPALNEEQNIAKVISAIPSFVDTVFVINDGSTDNTVAEAKKEGATVISHSKNKGVGAAFNTGVQTILQNPHDVMVNMDGDGQFNPLDIEKLIQPILDKQAQFVTASRFKDKAFYPDMPKMKFWGNKRMALLISRLTKQKFFDVSCGFRAYTYDTLLRLNLFGSFTYTQESFLDLAFKNVEMAEIPIKVRGVREHGKSRVASNLWKYAFNTSKIILRAFKDYKPLRLFGKLAILLFLIGLALAIFFFSNYFITGKFSPHLWAGFLSGFLFGMSFLVTILALISDILARMKRNQEQVLYLLKKNNKL